MAEHLHIDYPIGGASACSKLLEEIDWDKLVDDFSTIEMVKTIGLITIMYDFPELIANTRDLVVIVLTDGIILT